MSKDKAINDLKTIAGNYELRIMKLESKIQALKKVYEKWKYNDYWLNDPIDSIIKLCGVKPVIGQVRADITIGMLKEFYQATKAVCEEKDIAQ